MYIKKLKNLILINLILILKFREGDYDLETRIYIDRPYHIETTT